MTNVLCSPNMRPKQEEMDYIVEQIYEAMMEKAHLESTLLILIGDHGMNDGGNHGGSSAGETSTALVFISPKLDTGGLEAPGEPDEDDVDHLPSIALKNCNLVLG